MSVKSTIVEIAKILDVEISEDAQKALNETLTRLEAAAHNSGYADGRGDTDKPIYPDVDEATLDNIELGVKLLKSGDASAAVYLDRAFRDFNSSYV